MPRLIADMDAADYLAWKVREEMICGGHVEPPSEKELSERFRKIILERPLVTSPWPSELVERPNPETRPAEDGLAREPVGYVLWYPSGREFSECRPDANLGVKWDALYRSPVESVPVEKLRELEAEWLAVCADKGIAQPIAAAIRKQCADRLSAIVKEYSK